MPSPVLDQLYAGAGTTLQATEKADSGALPPVTESLLLNEAQAEHMAKELAVPELYIELKRAVWQVERAMTAEKKVAEEKVKEEEAHNNDTKKGN